MPESARPRFLVARVRACACVRVRLSVFTAETLSAPALLLGSLGGCCVVLTREHLELAGGVITS